jgi:hypothetical protein
MSCHSLNSLLEQGDKFALALVAMRDGTAGDFSYIKLGPGQLKLIGQSLAAHPRIDSLVLAHCCVDNMGLIMLAQALWLEATAQRWSGLRALDLSNNNISLHTEVASQHLNRLLVVCRHLEQLDLADNEIENVHLDHKTLASIDLSRNPLSPPARIAYPHTETLPRQASWYSAATFDDDDDDDDLGFEDVAGTEPYY